MKYLNRWLWYQLLTFRDILRQRKLLLVHVLIVAGICLPLFILAGLKRGHVQDLRRQLVSSPTGRQVTFWSATNGPILTEAFLQTIPSEHDSIELVIPEVKAVVGAVVKKNGATATLESLTLNSTLPGDPVLAQHGTGIGGTSTRDVVLSQLAASTLKVKPGDPVSLLLYRDRGEQHAVEFVVAGILGTGTDESATGFASVGSLIRVQQYLRGFSVPEWNIPAQRHLSAPDIYSACLLVCRASDDLSADDRVVLGERYDIRECDGSEGNLFCTLLKSDASGELRVYLLRPHSIGNTTYLTETPTEIDRRTGCDEVVLAWNPPMTGRVDDGEMHLLGLSAGQPKWLARYLNDPTCLFRFGQPERQIRFPGAGIHASPVSLETAEGITLSLAYAADPPGDVNHQSGEPAPAEPTTAPLAVVPAPLLAHLHGLRRSDVLFDSRQQVFVPVPSPPRFDKARLYARTIDFIPDAVDWLSSQRFAHFSESTRIAEIKAQDASLDLLVRTVAQIVCFFGVLTVAIVLLDSTARRRKDIGILRIMGVSSAAVLYMVLLRALVTGMLAAGAAWGLSRAACASLQWQPQLSESVPSVIRSLLLAKPHASASVDLSKDWPIALVAVLCSLTGALLPGLLASRLDPFDALVSGKEA